MTSAKPEPCERSKPGSKCISGSSEKASRILKNLLQCQLSSQSASSLKPELDYEKVKLQFISFDSGKLTSTIINLDIEELCHCLACTLLKHIEYTMQSQQDNNNASRLESFIEQIDEDNHSVDLEEEQKDEILVDPQSIQLQKDRQVPQGQSDGVRGREQLPQTQPRAGENIARDSAGTPEEQPAEDSVEKDNNLREFEESRNEMEDILKESMVKLTQQQQQLSKQCQQQPPAEREDEVAEGPDEPSNLEQVHSEGEEDEVNDADEAQEKPAEEI